MAHRLESLFHADGIYIPMVHETKVTRARWWLALVGLLETLARAAVPAALIFLAAVALQKFIIHRMPWPAVWSVAGTTLAASIAWFTIRRLPSRTDAAVQIDLRYALRERFLSALYAATTDHPFRSAILADAERFAPQVAVRRLASPRVARPVLLAAAVALGALAYWQWGPERDFLGHKARAKSREAADVAIAQQARRMAEVEKRLAAAGPSLQPMTSSTLQADIEKLKRDFAAPDRRDARDALAKVSSLADRVEAERKRLEAGAKPELTSNTLTAPDSPTGRLERALHRGDAARAKAEVKRLRDALGQAGRTPTDDRKLGQDLAALGESASSPETFGSALADAGKSLQAGHTDAARQALDRAADTLAQMASAQVQARALEAVAAELEQAKRELASAANAGAPDANGMQAGGQQSSSSTASGGEAAAGSNGQGAQASVGQQGQTGTSGAQSGTDGTGDGSQGSQTAAGPDWGRGTTNLEQTGTYDVETKPGSPRQQARDSQWTEQFVKLYDPRTLATQQQNQQASGKMGSGKFDATIEAPGPATRDAARAPIGQAFLDYRNAQKDAISREEIPPDYKEAVKTYFDSLEPPK